MPRRQSPGAEPFPLSTPSGGRDGHFRNGLHSPGPDDSRRVAPMRIPFQTALITGSSRGIGRGIAVKLATEGVKKIAVHYLSRKDDAAKTLSRLRDIGADWVLVQGDTSNASRAEDLVHEAAQKLGGCDIFVQSVIPRLEDIDEHTLATEVPLAKWQLAFDTQVRAF